MNDSALANNTTVIPSDETVLPHSIGALGTLQVLANKVAVVVVIIIVVAGIFLLYRFFSSKKRQSKMDSSRYRRLNKSENHESGEDEDHEITVYEKN